MKSVKKHKITPLLDDEIPAFLKAIEADPEFKNAYAFCLFTGIREGECLGLMWDKVDVKGKCITVEQQLQKDRQKSGTYFIKNATKTKKQRTVYLTEDAVACLEDEKKRQEENAKLAGELWDNEWNLVFTNDLGRYIIPMTFYKHFKRIAEKIGRPDLRPHDLRHPYVKHMTKNIFLFFEDAAFALVRFNLPLLEKRVEIASVHLFESF